jgi:DNA-binding protein Fis
VVNGLLAEARQTGSGTAYDKLIEEAERELFTQAIRIAEGNQAKAARWLGLSRLTLREKLHRYGRHRTQQESSPEGTS